jgi:L-fuconolactonase
MQIKVIDTHIHVWDLTTGDYPWLKGDTSILNRTYKLKELEPERQRAGVVAGVLVQAAGNLEDTALMIQTAKDHPWITGVVGWLPLKDPDATARILEDHYQPGSILKGVRHQIHDESDPKWLLQERVLESLGQLAARDISYDLVGVQPEHIRTALKVANRWPSLRMIFDHLNQPPIGQPDEEWQSLMRTASTHHRFYAKISGLATAAKKGMAWTAADLAPSIEFALRHFGVDRCCCGGDWPVSLLAGTYEKTWEAYRSVISKILDPKDRTKVFVQNAERFYRLPSVDNK